MRPLVVFLCFCALMLAALRAGAASTIEGVRLWPAPDHTRVVFDITGQVKHKVFTLENPPRLVVDLEDTKAGVDLSRLELAGDLVKTVRHAPRNNNGLRVVFDLNQPIDPRSFVLPPNEQYGDRLVVDLFSNGSAVAVKPVVKKSIDDRRDIVIAIDAGHGGEDPGALGKAGVIEKHVVLAIARELSRLFVAEAGYKPVLIREADYYIALRQRTENARRNSADMMISIHADAFTSPLASGASVYALSKKGATSETARWLAERENSADLIGGVGYVSLDDKDQMLAGVLLDLSMTASMRTSMMTGASILEELGKVTKLHKRNVEQAGFMVLKSPDIPSLLVETGFVSSPTDAKNLSNKAHQQALARAIFRGIKKYFDENPPPGTYVAWARQQRKEPRDYRIARGDTLSGIAVRNNVSESELKQFNGLTSDMIRVGQVIQIPSS